MANMPVVNVAIDFENNGTFVDVSSYLKAFKITRGSSRVEGPIVRYEAGKCELVLDNSDRRFDPTNLSGPYTTPSGSPGSGVQQAQVVNTQSSGFGVTVSIASTDPDTANASLRDATSTTSTSTSFTCTKPSGTTSGDILVAFQAADWGSASDMGNPTGGSSWGSPVVSLDVGTNDLHVKVWIKTAGGSEPASYGFTQGTFSDGVVCVAAVRDATLSYVTDTDTNHGTAFFTTPSVTPVGTADYELRYVAGTGTGLSGQTWDWSGTDGPYTELEDAQSGTFTTASLAGKSTAGLVTGTGGTLVKPMRPVRVRAIWSGTTYDLYRGYVDSWEITWQDPNWSEVLVPCTDAFKIFAHIDRKSSESVSAASELTSARITRILDNIGWSASLRSIATGDVTLQSTTLNGNIMEELLVTNETEVGELYMTADGKVFFRNRNAINNDSRSTTSNATFGDGGGSELPYISLTFSNDDTQLVNRVLITRVGGSEQVAEDTASQLEYLVRSYERTDLLFNNDAAALNMAQWVLSLSAQPELRFETLEIMPSGNDATTLFPHALNRLIGDRITVRRRPPGGGDMIEQDAFIRGIEHEVTPAKWVTRWTLQSTAAGGSFFIIGNSTRGRLDNNPLGF